MVAVARSDRFSPNTKKKVIYQDIYTSIFLNNDTKDVESITNEDSVKQSIVNLILTNRGERLFNSSLGSDINYLLFENITPQTSTTLIKFIKTTIENYEPRADVLEVIAEPLEEQNAYRVVIVFKVINKTEPITIDFLLNRVR
ncbi:hypothetical protein EBU71_09300 [bacterium]|nr:hypothetical protein [Candidatus Elulimicrobium humile]